MRRNPAHCSNAFGPSRGTSFSALRDLNGPLASRCCTMLCARPVPMPDTRASSGAEAVLASTPTALTQSSTTASSERASLHSPRSCWYWPTPIAFGSIFTSSASGSCRRRAIDTAPRSVTSSSGQFFGRKGRRRIDRRAGLRHHDLRHLQVGQQLDQIDRQLVGLARRGAVADRDQVDLVLRGELAERRERRIPGALRFVRIDRRRRDHLAGGVDHGGLARRSDNRDRGPW